MTTEAMGISDAALAEHPARADGPTDHELVRWVRRGDERAFELLYERYQRRIGAYVFGMVKDHGRAEDITQEVFVSALRRMRATERPIAFKPWVYEIAKNACIDSYRRTRRTEEVSFDADDRLSPSDYGRLVSTGPGPDAALDAKQDLDHLCGAFGGLSESHHQILVMRELEGLSYKDIGERMGMSRPAVESTLFRARKRLGEEYDELASGARCLRIQATIDGQEAGGGRLGLRDQRKLAKHIAHCQPCRRLAVQAGIDVPVPVRRRVAGKIAALLPLPAFLRFRRGGEDAVATGAGGGGGGSWAIHAPAFADAFQSGWGKAAAGLAAVLVAGAGAGISTQVGGKPDGRDPGAQPAVERTTPSGVAETRTPRPAALVQRRSGERKAGATANARRKGSVARPGRRDRDRGAGRGESVGGNAPKPQTPASAPAGGGSGPQDAPGGGRPDDRAGGGSERAPSTRPPADKTPVPDVPGGVGGSGSGQKLQDTVDNVDTTVQNAAGNLGNTTQQAAQNLENTLSDPQNLVPNVAKTVDDAVKGVDQTVNGALGDVGNVVGDLLKP